MKYLKSSKIIQSLAHNTLPKLICLLLAIITWFIVMENKNPLLETVYRDIPVELLGIEQVENRGLIIEESSGDRVDVTVSGRWRDIIKMKESSLRLTASLDSIVGKGTTKLMIDRRISSAGISILSLSRDSLEITVDAIETVKKPINLLVRGELPEDLEMGSLVYKDEEISVTGPSRQLKEIAYLQGELDLGPITSTTTGHIGLEAVDVNGRSVEGVELESSSLSVSIPIIGTKLIPLEISTEGDIRTNYRLIEKVASQSQVTVRGDTNLLSAINEVRTKPVSIKNADKSFEAMLELDLPKDVSLVDTQAIIGKFTIAPLDNKRFSFSASDVKLLGKDDKYEYVIDSNLNINLEVKDVRDIIRDIDEKKISLETDVNGLSEGNYSLQISVKGIPESSHYSISELSLIIIEKGE